MELSANGRQALDRLAGGDEACDILLDLMMPVMDGWEFRRHQSEDASLRNIPTIVVSAAGRDRMAWNVLASWGGHAPYWNLIGNGGMISSVTDFIAFRKAFVAGQIVPPQLVQLAQTKHIAETPARTSYYGYGLVVQDHPELGRIYWHDGGNDIFSAIWMDLDAKGDLIFTAAADTEAGGATTALAVLISHLYGVALK